MASASSKKRKRGSDVSSSHQPDTSKPTAIFQPTEGRKWTLSVALPGSIIQNAQTHDLKTSLAGTIARALAVFCVDEVIIFSDQASATFDPPPARNPHSSNRNNATHHGAGHNGTAVEDGYTGMTDPSKFLARLLSYLETPPYLRRALFPLHPDLRTAGTLPSTDMPHHVRTGERVRYREGVAVGEHSAAKSNGDAGPTNGREKKKKKRKPRAFDDVDVEMSAAANGNEVDGTGAYTYVDAGLDKHVRVLGEIPARSRVTLDFGEKFWSSGRETEEKAVAVHPDTPRTESGLYWGYTVRETPSLSGVFTECPYSGGYDVSIGTSERGKPLIAGNGDIDNSGGALEEVRWGGWTHLLVVFGGVAGLEAAVSADENLRQLGVTEAAKLFDHWVNVVPGQGSRTIRTEEAVWIGLMAVRGAIAGHQPTDTNETP